MGSAHLRLLPVPQAASSRGAALRVGGEVPTSRWGCASCQGSCQVHRHSDFSSEQSPVPSTALQLALPGAMAKELPCWHPGSQVQVAAGPATKDPPSDTSTGSPQLCPTCAALSLPWPAEVAVWHRLGHRAGRAAGSAGSRHERGRR